MFANDPNEERGFTSPSDSEEWLRANERTLEEDSKIVAAQKAAADRVYQEARQALEALEADDDKARQQLMQRWAEMPLNKLSSFWAVRRAKQDRATMPLVIVPPGYNLAEIARFLLTRKAYQLYVGPVIADMQREYIDAIAAGRERQARWIAIRVYLLIIPNWLYAFVAGKLAALLRRGS